MWRNQKDTWGGRETIATTVPTQPSFFYNLKRPSFRAKSQQVKEICFQISYQKKLKKKRMFELIIESRILLRYPNISNIHYRFYHVSHYILRNKDYCRKKKLSCKKANILEMFSTWKIALLVNLFSSVNHWNKNQQDYVALHYNSKKIVYTINERIH